MTPETIGAQGRPEQSGSSTIVSITDMPNSAPSLGQAEPGSAHELILDQLDQDQAQDLVTIPLEGKSSIADHMVIASGRSTRQVASMAQKLTERIKKDLGRNVRIEGLPVADWVLIDAEDVIVHIFRPEVRSFYNLERMWAFEGAPEEGRAAASGG